MPTPYFPFLAEIWSREGHNSVHSKIKEKYFFEGFMTPGFTVIKL
jgi:hypothetical protein